jgi:hypothetical protein
MVQPRDLIATLFHCLGIPADTVVTDREGRSVPVVHGEVIEAIL